MEVQAIVYACVFLFCFQLSRQFPIYSSFFRNSVNHIWSMVAKLKANYKQLTNKMAKLGGKLRSIMAKVRHLPSY